MKMAKANERDLDMALKLSSAFESLQYGYLPDGMTEGDEPGAEEGVQYDERKHAQAVVDYLRRLTGSASLFRVTMGMSVVLDPRNALVDPDADTLERHPDVIAAAKDAERYRALRLGRYWSVIDGIGDTLCAESLDAAVDSTARQTPSFMARKDSADGGAVLYLTFKTNPQNQLTV
jgi:hypothetical protein